MPFKHILPFISVALVCGLSCLPPHYSVRSLPDEQLRFGSYGGFSGARKEYIMLKNGQVFLLETLGAKRDTVQLEAFAAGEMRPLFKRLDTLRLFKYDFNYPGNMTWFIRQVDAKTDFSVQWGDPAWQVRPDVADFHRQLSDFVKDRKHLPKEEPDPANPAEPH